MDLIFDGFKSRFCPSIFGHINFERLSQYKLELGEDIEKYIIRFDNMVKLLELSDRDSVRHFILSIKLEEIKEYLMITDPQTLKEAYDSARKKSMAMLHCRVGNLEAGVSELRGQFKKDKCEGPLEEDKTELENLEDEMLILKCPKTTQDKIGAENLRSDVTRVRQQLNCKNRRKNSFDEFERNYNMNGSGYGCQKGYNINNYRNNSYNKHKNQSSIEKQLAYARRKNKKCLVNLSIQTYQCRLREFINANWRSEEGTPDRKIESILPIFKYFYQTGI